MCPDFKFEQVDVFKTDLLETLSYDTVLIMEFLEHIEKDLEVLERLPANVYVWPRSQISLRKVMFVSSKLAKKSKLGTEVKLTTYEWMKFLPMKKERNISSLKV